jgi:small nuclear ribonucleoprotein (snRNP)-like protein
MKVARRVLLIGTLCFLVVSARPDQVTLNNGDRLTGTIVKSDAKIMLIKTEFAGEVNVHWDAVTSITSKRPLYVGLKDGETVVGTVATTDGKFEVATKTTGEVTAAKDVVVANTVFDVFGVGDYEQEYFSPNPPH